MKSVLCWLFFGALLCVAGCAPQPRVTQSSVVEALDPGVAECEACGMVVAEQPAPRGQLVYRDGTRKFFCSIADMMVNLQSPSALGRPEACFVEILSPDQDPEQLIREPQPWLPCDQVSFVLGIARKGIMGASVLTYGNEQDAARWTNSGGQVISWHQLGKAMNIQPSAH